MFLDLVYDLLYTFTTPRDMKTGCCIISQMEYVRSALVARREARTAHIDTSPSARCAPTQEARIIEVYSQSQRGVLILNT